jgi:hypothetical protein
MLWKLWSVHARISKASFLRGVRAARGLPHEQQREKNLHVGQAITSSPANINAVFEGR